MKFKGVASGDYLNWFKTLPVDTDGFVKDPRYLTGHRHETYLKAWREWCRLNPKQSEWPDFIHALILETKLVKSKG